jgi:hypothetical protein
LSGSYAGCGRARGRCRWVSLAELSLSLGHSVKPRLASVWAWALRIVTAVQVCRPPEGSLSGQRRRRLRRRRLRRGGGPPEAPGPASSRCQGQWRLGGPWLASGPSGPWLADRKLGRRRRVMRRDWPATRAVAPPQARASTWARGLAARAWFTSRSSPSETRAAVARLRRRPSPARPTVTRRCDLLPVAAAPLPGPARAPSLASCERQVSLYVSTLARRNEESLLALRPLVGCKQTRQRSAPLRSEAAIVRLLTLLYPT